MNLIVRGRPNFDPAVRAEVRRLTERGIHHGGSAHVVLADGLVGAAARAFMSTSVLLGRPKNPTRVFGELDPAATWMAGQLGLAAAPIVDACQAIVSGIV
ncbi:MAG: hypothetical protein H6719_37170 [Sandaracinaceae bacterium]|nr:hypothetical protein [Sandaracinaceae bacterium]